MDIYRRAPRWGHPDSHGWPGYQRFRSDRIKILRRHLGWHVRAMSGLVHWILRQKRRRNVECIDWWLGMKFDEDDRGCI